MLTIQDALAGIATVDDAGYTFVDDRGMEEYWSFRDLILKARHHAGALRRSGLLPGDRIALIIPDHHAFVVTFLAALHGGIVPVPIYPPPAVVKLETWVETAAGILAVSRPKAIVTSDALRNLLGPMADRFGLAVLAWSDLADRLDDVPPARVDPGDTAFVQFTSGSTVAPRGVVVSHRNVAANCTSLIREFLNSASGDKGLSWLPLFHDMGLTGFVLAPLFAARPVVFLATASFVKRPLRWFDLISRHRATVTSAPNFGYALAERRVTAADLAGLDLSCLRVAGCGGEPIVPDTLRAFAARFAPAGFRPEAFQPCYGMAECTLMGTHGRGTTGWRSDVVDAARLQETGEAVPAAGGAAAEEFVGCGAPMLGHDIRILDRAGNPVPERVVGEIELRGPSVADGYVDDSAATAETFGRGGLLTGDLGYLVGRDLFVTGRKKDLIIVQGRNFSPQSIERSVAAIAGLRAGGVAAFSRPGQRGTEEVVVACEATATDARAIEEAVRARVANDCGLALAGVVVLRPGDLPRTSSGKLQRSRARDLHRRGLLARGVGKPSGEPSAPGTPPRPTPPDAEPEGAGAASAGAAP